MSGIPVTIEPGFSTAVTNLNNLVSGGTATQAEIAAAEAITAQYRGIQWAQNYTANQATVRSLADQLAAAEVVSSELLQKARQYNPGAATSAAVADRTAAVEWQNTREATIAASVTAQFTSVADSMPAN